ncbi:MAG: kynureninase, partial [Bdellovibrionales bacterium]|nr:kynureninase [Bdellovibrionales bacterium]
ARLVGAKPNEVVAMNSLTVNLHLMMVSFYRPSPTKHKILIENNTFPSDRYAVISQARSHGFDPTYSIIETKPLDGEMTVTTESILSQIEENKGSLALVMLGNCNYLSGQKFDFEKIVKAAHDAGARVGFNLAHGAGNLKLQLHDWNVDFAVWCSYKYLNSGPGGIAGAFIHEDQMKKPRIQRFEGWWGTNKETRFQMKPDFEAIPTVEAWQLSNPPIFQLASLRASLELFDRAGMERISQKQSQITTYFEELLRAELGEKVQIVTPKERGSMLCLKVKDAPKEKVKNLSEKNVHLDFREPDIIRATPAPLYNSYSDVFHLVQELKSILQ